MDDEDEYTPQQRLLMKIRDERCNGVAAELARKIKKDPTYVNRLLYPIGKKGRKGIGLEIMRACTEAFTLPAGYWDGVVPDDAEWPFSAELQQKVLVLKEGELLKLENIMRGYVELPQVRLTLAVNNSEPIHGESSEFADTEETEDGADDWKKHKLPAPKKHHGSRTKNQRPSRKKGGGGA